MTPYVVKLPFSLDPLMAEAKRRMRQRRLLVAALVMAVAAAAAGTTLMLRGPSAPGSAAMGGSLPSQGVSAATNAALCLSRHGWKVAQHLSGVVVAMEGPYRLVYQPARRVGPIVQTGWSGYGPRRTSPYMGEGATKINGDLQVAVPACFSQYAHSIHSFASSSH